MTEKEIQLLGFDKKHTKAGDVMSSYYYELTIKNASKKGGLLFVTPTNVNADKGWWISIYETQIKYHNFEEAQALLNNLERHVEI